MRRDLWSGQVNLPVARVEFIVRRQFKVLWLSSPGCRKTALPSV